MSGLSWLVLSLLTLPWRWLARQLRGRTKTRQTVSWSGLRVEEHYRDGELVGRTVHDFDVHGQPIERHLDARGNRIRETRPHRRRSGAWRRPRQRRQEHR